MFSYRFLMFPRNFYCFPRVFGLVFPYVAHIFQGFRYVAIVFQRAFAGCPRIFQSSVFLDLLKNPPPKKKKGALIRPKIKNHQESKTSFSKPRVKTQVTS